LSRRPLLGVPSQSNVGRPLPIQPFQILPGIEFLQTAPEHHIVNMESNRDPLAQRGLKTRPDRLSHLIVGVVEGDWPDDEAQMAIVCPKDCNSSPQVRNDSANFLRRQFSDQTHRFRIDRRRMNLERQVSGQIVGRGPGGDAERPETQHPETQNEQP